MNLPGALSDWWNTRAPRERTMLAVMLLALVAFLAWFAVMRPLGRWEAAAADDRQAAAAALAGVRAGRAELEAFQVALPGPTSGPAALQGLLPRTAAAAGVPLSRQQPREGLLTIGIDAVAAPALLAWLDTLAGHGVAPVALEVGERNGALYADLAFAQTPPGEPAFAEPAD